MWVFNKILSIAYFKKEIWKFKYNYQIDKYYIWNYNSIKSLSIIPLISSIIWTSSIFLKIISPELMFAYAGIPLGYFILINIHSSTYLKITPIITVFNVPNSTPGSYFCHNHSKGLFEIKSYRPARLEIPCKNMTRSLVHNLQNIAAIRRMRSVWPTYHITCILLESD